MAISSVPGAIAPQRGTEQSATVNPGQSQGADPLQRGRELYEAGQYEQAIPFLEQAVGAYQSQGNPFQQATTLANLSLVYQQLGQWQKAMQAIESSLQLLENGETKDGIKQDGIKLAKQDKQRLLARALEIHGRLLLAKGDGENALTRWQQAERIYGQLNDQEGVMKTRLNQAQALRSLGFYRRALELLTDLRQTLETQPDSEQKAATLRNLGDGLQLAGDLPQAQKVLEQSLKITQKLNLPTETGITLLSLGNAARVQSRNLAGAADPQKKLGAAKKVQEAIAYYERVVASAAPSTTKVQAQLNWLGMLMENQRWEDAQRIANQLAPQLPQLPSGRTGIYARINFVQTLLKPENPLGNSPIPLPPAKPIASLVPLFPNLLQQALQQARALADMRAESYALGSLGMVYEQTGQLSEAKAVTRKALALAQTDQAGTITYRWQWQMGRLFWREGNLPEAIAAYDRSVTNLQALRGDIAAINPDVQFNFRDSVEPIYRQSITLLLQSLEQSSLEAPSSKQKALPMSASPDQKQANKTIETTLNTVRQRMEDLQLAELDNFFREACLVGRKVVLDKVVDQDNPTSAILYPIVVRNPRQAEVTIEVVAKIPQKPLKRYSTKVSTAEFEAAIAGVQTGLTKVPTASNLAMLRSHSQKIYTWLIKPIENELATPVTIQPIPTQQITQTKPNSTDWKTKTLTQTRPIQAIPPTTSTTSTANLPIPKPSTPNSPNNVDTLVFILDDSLRNVPMAVLWDGQRYLVEKYGIALSLGLQLIEPQPITQEPLKVLAAGLSQPPPGSPINFSPLKYVQSEIQSIAKLGISIIQLLDQDFTSEALTNKINANPFNIVHLATHGEFSSRAEDTYILAANGPINVTEIDTLLRNRNLSRPEAIQLLVLSACQTAANDNRATLGLAGFAVRAGARSTLASLRNASDEATPLLIEEFYRQLNNPKETLTKAEALRRAQLALLQNPNNLTYRYPQYWAAYVLIGNWL
jgi:CHAT domain-containing protein/tetratricopeptide (TPR) repeat protein